MKTYLAIVLASAIALFSTALMAEPVNINTASAEEIAQALNGVGESKAAAIVAQREAHGPFKSADELTMVKGIGPMIVEKNRADIQL